ncbi:MAG: GerW family sporulation protein [Clostridia bacterium]|nr:GerW family sporulation protein [Clostridia bacterium]
MEKHPIENIMSTTLENIRDMIDVNTVIGEPITAADGSTVIPISRVSFGFVAGGGEYACKGTFKPDAETANPFAGGTGAGVTVQPLGFLVTSADQTRMLPAQCFQPLDRVIELIPQVVADVKKAIK